MISVSTIRTYMFCPLKLYFQSNLNEDIEEDFTVSKTVKELRIDLQDIYQRNMRHLNKDMSLEEIENKLSRQVNDYIKTNFAILEEEKEDDENFEELEEIIDLRNKLIEESKLTAKLLSIKAKQAMNSFDKDGSEIYELFFPTCMYNYLIRDLGLDIVGVIDKIEVIKGNYYPITFKSNNPPLKGVWDADLIEIVANAILIEQEFDTQVYVGFIDYLTINERRPVTISTDLRKTLFRILTEINRIKRGDIPKVKNNLKKCKNCEYKELCDNQSGNNDYPQIMDKKHMLPK